VDPEVVKEALLARKAPPPNQSTQTQPLSSANFLHELDCVTKEITGVILAAQKEGAVQGDQIRVMQINILD